MYLERSPLGFNTELFPNHNSGPAAIASSLGFHISLPPLSPIKCNLFRVYFAASSPPRTLVPRPDSLAVAWVVVVETQSAP